MGKWWRIVLVAMAAVVIALPAALAQEGGPGAAPEKGASPDKPEKAAPAEAEKQRHREVMKALRREMQALRKQVAEAKKAVPEGEEFKLPEELDRELTALAGKYFDETVKVRGAKLAEFEAGKGEYINKKDGRLITPPEPGKKKKDGEKGGKPPRARKERSPDIIAENKRYRGELKPVRGEYGRLRRKIQTALKDASEEEKTATLDKFKEERVAVCGKLFELELAHRKRLLEIFKSHKDDFVARKKSDILNPKKRRGRKKKTGEAPGGQPDPEKSPDSK